MPRTREEEIVLRAIATSLFISTLFVAIARPNPASGQCEVAKLTASDAACGDRFGWTSAISGDVVVIGTPFHDGHGAAYVYRRRGHSWIEEAKLVPHDASLNHWFGWSVTVDGDVVVVGAIRDGERGTDAGAAYVFRWDGSQWSQEQKLLGRTSEAGDAVGYYVGIDGGTIAMGAPGHDAGGANAGAVFLLRHEGGKWIHLQKLLPSDPGPQDAFGIVLSLRGDVLGVTACCTGVPDLSRPGAAYVFRDDGTGWFEQQKLIPVELGVDDFYGASISVDRGTIVVGSPAFSGEGIGLSSGSAFVYSWDGDSWEPQDRLQVESPNDLRNEFGNAVAIEGHSILVGAREADQVGAAIAGAIYVFKQGPSNWIQAASVAPADRSSGDTFGSSVAMDSDYVVGGSLYDDDTAQCGGVCELLCDSGSGYVFRLRVSRSDLNDFARMQTCVGAPATQGTCCGIYDFTFDSQIDLADHRIVVDRLGGP